MKMVILHKIFVGALGIVILGASFAPIFVFADSAGLPIVQTLGTGGVGDTAAYLNGSVNPDGAQTNYWFEYGTDAWSLQARTGTQPVGSTGTYSVSVYASLTNLSANITYYYRVVAQNAYGTSFGSTLSFRTSSSNNGGNGSQPTVTTSYANTVNQTSVSLTGSVSPNQSDTYAWFDYGISPGSLSNSAESTFVGRSYGALPFSKTITNLFPGTLYYFRAVARNSYGTVYGETLSVRTEIISNTSINLPQAITDAPNILSESAASFTGRVNANGSATSAWFEYGPSSIFGNRSVTQSMGSANVFVPLTYVANNLVPGSTYYVRLVAQSSSGISYGSVQTFQTRKTVVVKEKLPVTSVTPSNTVANNSVSAIAPGTTLSCLTLAPNFGSSSFRPSGQFIYTVTYRNGCTSELKNASLTIALPQYVSFLSTDLPLSTLGNNTLTYRLGDIPRGTQTTLHIRGVVDRDAQNGDNLLFGSLMAFVDSSGTNQNVNIYLSGNVGGGGFSATAGLLSAFGSIGDGWLIWILLLVVITTAIYFIFFKKKTDKTPKKITVVS